MAIPVQWYGTWSFTSYGAVNAPTAVVVLCESPRYDDSRLLHRHLPLQPTSLVGESQVDVVQV
jgi:hypothetical protein